MINLFNKNKIARSFMLIYFKTKNYIYNISLEIHLASSGKSRVSVYEIK